MIEKTDKERLVLAAATARKNAYAPYSKYKVGAAILTDKGEIFIGCNFENAAFNVGVCAERVALGNALSYGNRSFKAICVCGNDVNITPCGSCRQALIEFQCNYVICCDDNGHIKEYSISELLPHSFNSALL